MRAGLVALAALALGCGPESDAPGSSAAATTGAGTGGAGAEGGTTSVSSTGVTGGGGSGATGGGGGCLSVGASASVEIAKAPTSDEYALRLTATSDSHTLWAEAGNEALVLEVTGARGLIGHLVLHQGAAPFQYTMTLGALDAGETVSVRVSPLSAASATPSACVGPAVLAAAADLGADADGLVHAPILRWPREKRFDDLPVLLGWSKAKLGYQAVYTSENGGTVAICGGGATGMQAEMARWGRGCDIEGLFSYGGATPTWGRCSGTTGFDSVQPVMEGEHPVLYYGDGHNRLFESRGGYGKTCGGGGDAKADGDLVGWNVQNPGNDPANDGDFVIVLRPLPVSLDEIGYDTHAGRREGLLDVHAPWIYRLTGSELAREGKIDQSKTWPMDNYLYVDVLAADVGGTGDPYCSPIVSGGFKLRVKTADGQTHDGTQMTNSYFGGDPDWKRLAVPLGKVYANADVVSIVFDAYDNDGIYWLSLGDAFIARPEGDNGATIDHVHTGGTAIDVYVDDDDSGCTNGMNPDGPAGPYPCVGSLDELAF